MNVFRRTFVPVLVATLSGCTALAGEPVTVEPAVAIPVLAPASPLPQPVEATACIDGTLSLSRASVQRAKDAVADAVAAWPAVSGPAAVPSLDLRVRRIDGRSYAAGEVARASVPAVGPLLPEPAVDDPNFLEAVDRYETSKAARPPQFATAVAAARRAADAVRPLDLTARASEIAGCTSAAVESMDPAAARRIIVWSDLVQTGTAQVAGDLTGVAVLVVQVCDGDASQCAQHRDSFLKTVTARGGSASVVRPERAASVLLPFLRTGVA